MGVFSYNQAKNPPSPPFAKGGGVNDGLLIITFSNKLIPMYFVQIYGIEGMW
jgi:hypothetical protein